MTDCACCLRRKILKTKSSDKVETGEAGSRGRLMRQRSVWIEGTSSRYSTQLDNLEMILCLWKT